jgi:hypothetical protein
MRKLVSGLSLIFCFALGLAASSVGTRYNTVSFCDVDTDPESYAGKMIKLRAFISNDNGFINAFSLCSENTPGAAVTLDSHQTGLLPENRYVRGQEAKDLHLAEVIMIGRLEPPNLGITHCFGPKYEISEAKIEHVVSEHHFQNSEKVAQWMKTQAK